jgi:hypothetical protein
MRSCANLRLLVLILLAIHPLAEKESRKITATSGTLILIGASATDLTIATDSRATNGAGLKTTATKIFPISKFAVCTLNNAAGITLRIGNEVLDTIQFDETIQRWANEHPTSSVKEAHEFLSQIITNEMATFLLLHRDIPPPRVIVSLVCFGYDSETSVLYTADIYAPDSSDSKPFLRSGSFNPPPGFSLPLGESQICKDILGGNSPYLAKYRETLVVKKYHNLKDLGRLATITTIDLLELSKTCLVATESTEGLQFDQNAFLVGAPNYYAAISRRNGFHKLPPPRR